jgi:hypothetical protein
MVFDGLLLCKIGGYSCRMPVPEKCILNNRKLNADIITGA